MDVLLGLAMLALGVMVYFCPAYIAWAKGRNNVGAIFALNLLLGWTFLGWVVALVWALTNKPDLT